MTKQQQHEVDALVANGWNHRSAIAYVLIGTPPGISRLYKRAVMVMLGKAVKAYERKHGIAVK